MTRRTTKIIFLLVIIIIGGSLIGYGAFGDFTGGERSNNSGILYGVGAGLIGAAFAQLATIKLYTKNPKLLHQKTVAYTDERNTTIRNKAKSKVYDIFNVVFPIMIFGLVIVNVSFVITGLFLALYGVRAILLIAYTNKYNGEM